MPAISVRKTIIDIVSDRAKIHMERKISAPNAIILVQKQSFLEKMS
jgi:hypothetical protein